MLTFMERMSVAKKFATVLDGKCSAPESYLDDTTETFQVSGILFPQYFKLILSQSIGHSQLSYSTPSQISSLYAIKKQPYPTLAKPPKKNHCLYPTPPFTSYIIVILDTLYNKKKI